MVKLLRKVVMAGLGVEAKLSEKLDELAAQGEASATPAAKCVKDAFDRVKTQANDLERKEKELLDHLLHKVRIPTTADIERLEAQLRDIAARMGGSGRAGAP